MLTDQQQKFIELSTKYESLKNELKNVGEELNNVLTEIGVGTSFQNPEDKTVFEVIVPSGAFISYKTIDYNRTKKEGERAGTLSIKRAKELGFEL